MILVVEDYDGQYEPFWAHLGETLTDETVLFKKPDLIRLVCFTGGEDVSPELYGHQNLGSHCSRARDEHEQLIFRMAHKHKIPMTGICRGSQFLNVMCGGTMVQDLRESHGGARHDMMDAETLRIIRVTSSHHQMSVLGPGSVCLGYSTKSVSTDSCKYDGDLRIQHLVFDGAQEESVRVTEAFTYPKANIFAVQHHPEWQNIEEEAPQWTLRKIRELCWNEGETVLETA